MLNPSAFDTQINGAKTSLITLKNSRGYVSLTNYGARIVEIVVPDQNGQPTNINLGHPSIEEYTRTKANYYGAVIGRVCGRIRENKFSIENQDFNLVPNNGATFLHGGENAFHTKVFTIENLTENSVTLTYHSVDGEEGFPGNLDLKVHYQWTEEMELMLDFEAVADQKTPFNITNHAYFNLNGEGNSDILKHQLKIYTSKYLPIREDILPTGEIASTENSPFDFSSFKNIGEGIDAQDSQIQYGSGYDHTFVLKTEASEELLHAATAVGDQSGIQMDVYTDQPGVHLYTGNFMDGSFLLNSGGKDERRTAFCLETQHLADALNHSHFPTIILEPGVKFKTRTVFKFSV